MSRIAVRLNMSKTDRYFSVLWTVVLKAKAAGRSNADWKNLSWWGGYPNVRGCRSDVLKR